MFEKTFSHILGFLLIFSLMVNLARSQDDDEDDPARTCQKYIYDFVMAILNGLLKCIAGESTFKAQSIYEYVTRSSCILKCILQNEHAIGLDGILNDVGAALFFEATFAPEVQNIALPLAQACFPLADDFNPKDYWCKSYLPFIECCFGAILSGLIPYGGDCITVPVLGIFFSVLKYLAPDSPKVSEEMDELRRAEANHTRIKCLDKDCQKMYEYKKVNGTHSIILYNKEMEVISVASRKTNPKSKSKISNNNINFKSNFNAYSYNVKNISKTN